MVQRAYDTDQEEQSLILDQAMAPRSKVTKFVYLASLLSGVGGLLFGYDTGIVSGAMVFIRDDFKLNDLWQESIVSVTILSAWLFSAIAGHLTESWGRKPVIILASLVFTGGAVLLSFSWSREILLMGRAILGAAIGLASTTIPMYIAEIAPAQVRGSLVTINVLCITGGQFLAALIAGFFSTDVNRGWRFMLGLAAVPAVVQFFGFLFMPESPRWLVRRGKYQEALTVLHKVLGTSVNVEEEFESIKETCMEQQREQAEKGGTSVFEQVIQNSGLRRALFVGCALQMIQQVSGVNSVMYYTATIIQMAGIHSKQKAVWLSVIVAGVNFLCTFIGYWLVERIGRRLLLLFSLAGVVVSLITLGAGFQIVALNSPTIGYHDNSTASLVCQTMTSCQSCTRSPSCGFCYVEDSTINGTCLLVDSNDHAKSTGGLCKSGNDVSKHLVWAYEWCPSSYSWITVLGLALYFFCFAPGMGPLPWTINSEIYPQWARSTCYATATSVNWFFNFLISLSFLTLSQLITKYGTFYLYASFALSGFVLFYFVLPETKGRSLEDVETLFQSDSTALVIGRQAGSSNVKYVQVRGINRKKTIEEQDSVEDN